MLGILLIFFIGKYFYELAQDYYKHRWLYGVLGIVVYYFGTMIGGFMVAILSELFGWNINFESSLTLTFIAIPSGLIFAVIFYFLLQRNWKNSVIEVKDEIQDIGKHSNDDLEENS